MSAADDNGLDVVASDADAFGAHAVGGVFNSDIVDDDEASSIRVPLSGNTAPSTRALPFAAACRQYQRELSFGDIAIVRQLVLAEPTGKDAVALRDLIKSVLKKTPPEVVLYDAERAQHIATYPEEWREGVRDRLDYNRRMFEFYAIALMRLEARIARDPRKAIAARDAAAAHTTRVRQRRAAAGGA